MLQRLSRGFGVAATGFGGYQLYNVSTGRVSWSNGHSYRKSFCLGKVSEFGSPEESIGTMCQRPNSQKQCFPMTHVAGNLEKTGDVALLNFACENANPVEVIERTPTSVSLRTLPGHMFQGIATHSRTERGGYLYHHVEGKGVPGESIVKQTANILFADFGWWVNLPWSESSKKTAQFILDSMKDSDY